MIFSKRTVVSKKDIYPKQIVITGSEGYIGTNLIEYLSEHAPDMKIREFDKVLGDEYRAESLYLHPDDKAIIHLAALPGVKDCEENYEEAIIDNLSTAFHVFDLGVFHMIPVIFASSQAAKHPGTSKYANMKYICETQAKRLNQYQLADIRLLRFCNLYGGKGYETRKNTVICKFLRKQREESTLIINGSGGQKRDFIHVKDVCRAIFNCLKVNRFDYPHNETIDIGTGKGVTILQLAKMFRNVRIDHNYSSDLIGPRESIADTGPAAKYLNFKAKSKLKKYIKKHCLHS